MRQSLTVLILLTAISAHAYVNSEWAGMLLTAPNDGREWSDTGSKSGPGLESRDLGGEVAGAQAIEMEPPEELAAAAEDDERGWQGELLDRRLEELVEESYGLVSEPQGPFHFGERGPVAAEMDFYAEGRFYREYLVWDGARLFNLTLWCRAGLAEGLTGTLDALLAGFRWK